ncbi:MAG: YeeE/YedE thiosulfate transporter family protein [Myxococcales bacterium]|nr:YeeE/YedE thiosulfate transporter family protein [Myxococcales bacterium]
MALWSWWLSSFALAAVPIAHWLFLNRAVAVSGRYSALIDRIRFGAPRDGSGEMDQAALLEALRAQTAADFGDDAIEETEPSGESVDETIVRSPQGSIAHLLFLAGLALGGAASAMLAGSFSLRGGLNGDVFASVVGQLGIPAPVLLLFGGLCVGFGTRMAAGCTSGHGLCGVSQFQTGSLVATAAFFGAGVGTSFALGALQ